MIINSITIINETYLSDSYSLCRNGVVYQSKVWKLRATQGEFRIWTSLQLWTEEHIHFELANLKYNEISYSNTTWTYSQLLFV